jgi:hypothetical protein
VFPGLFRESLPGLDDEGEIEVRGQGVGNGALM